MLIFLISLHFNKCVNTIFGVYCKHMKKTLNFDSLKCIDAIFSIIQIVFSLITFFVNS